MTDGYLLTKYLHLLAFVYWLGADLGVFYAARLAARGDLATAERRRALRLALLLDMGPRTGLIIVLPTGFTLTVLGGWLDTGSPAIVAAWLAAGAWLALAWWLFLAGEHPVRAAQRWRRVDLGVQGRPREKSCTKRWNSANGGTRQVTPFSFMCTAKQDLSSLAGYFYYPTLNHDAIQS